MEQVLGKFSDIVHVRLLENVEKTAMCTVGTDICELRQEACLRNCASSRTK
jgi:hypothetical protein